jgi:malate dehydrogenase (oxaloacetate-decarboxylating)(NADP+)
VRSILGNWPVPGVRVIVVTDGERILGLGDLGAHGMGIPIGKLSLYAACGGVHPDACLPVTIDVGTDNEALRADPLYTGLRRPRCRGAEYDELLEEFVEAVAAQFPQAILQWEDFATDNAIRLLARYQDRLCSFNDDIQGTAAVVLAALLSACRAKSERLRDQTLLFLGAGASATGVASLIAGAMAREGLSVAEARRRIWLFDSAGLIVASRGIVRAVSSINRRPIVFALSNPTSSSECTAEQAWHWSEGRALFASGSPFAPVSHAGRTLIPGQANNAYIFPGLGLGVLLAGHPRITDDMFHDAARTVAESVTPADLAAGTLLPPLAGIRSLSARIAARLANQDEGWVHERMYQPVYRDYVPAAERRHDHPLR